MPVIWPVLVCVSNIISVWIYCCFDPPALSAQNGNELAVNAMRDSVGPSIEIHGDRDKDGKPYITRKWLAISAEA